MTIDALRLRLALFPAAVLVATVFLSGCKSAPPPAPEKSATESPVAGPGPAQTAPTAQETGAAKSAFDSAQQAESAKQDRRTFLVGEYLTKGKEAYNRLEFSVARNNFASAYEIDPDNKEVQDWLRRSQAALGEAGPLRAEDLQNKSDLQIVRLAEARQKVAQSILEGDVYVEQRKFDDAIRSYRTAESILGFYPLLSDEKNDRKAVAAKIDEALRRKDEARREDEESQRKQALAAKQEREAEARRQLEDQIRKLYSDANVSYLNEQYAEATRSLDLLLEIDPRNERALELRDIVQQSRNDRLVVDTRKSLNQRWRQAFSELDRMMLPQTETIVHDVEHWARIADRKPLQFQARADATTPEDQAVLAALRTTMFQPTFSNVLIEDIVGYLRNLVQVNFVLSQKILEMDEGQRRVSIELPRRSVSDFLDALKLVKNFSWRVEDGLVRIGTPEEMKGTTEVRSYDVSDLTEIIPNYAGPEITLLAPSQQGIPSPADPDPQPVFTGDQIITLVQNTIAPTSWADTEAKTSIKFVAPSGTLIIRQTPEVHALLEKFLNDLREVTGLMVEVTTRFLIAEDNFLEDIGVDWRGLGDNGNSGVPPSGGLGSAPPFDDFGQPPLPGTPGQPGPLGTGNQSGFFTNTGNVPVLGRTENIFDQSLSGNNALTNSGGLSLQWISLGTRQSEMIIRAVEKSQRAELVTAPRLLIHSGARSHIAVTNQFAYVAGYGVEIAQASSIADPQIDVVSDGAILDVRPVVSADRKFVKLELRPTLATLLLPIQQRTVGVGNGTPVTIQFPNLTLRKVRTTVSIPDGGTLLLGGQSIDEIRDFASGTPVLRDIPILGFFFDRKGQSVQKHRLLILLRVKIVIPAENEPRIPNQPSTLLNQVAASVAK